MTNIAGMVLLEATDRNYTAIRSALSVRLVSTLTPMRRLWEFLRTGHPIMCLQETCTYVRNGILRGDINDNGVVSRNRVTNAGLAYLASLITNGAIATWHIFNYHGTGTGTNAESVNDTTLQTEIGSRVSGTRSRASSRVARTLAEITYSNTYAITEHGVFSASTSGTLWDRSVFTAKNVVNGDKLQFTYDLTFGEGG